MAAIAGQTLVIIIIFNPVFFDMNSPRGVVQLNIR